MHGKDDKRETSVEAEGIKCKFTVSFIIDTHIYFSYV